MIQWHTDENKEKYYQEMDSSEFLYEKLIEESSLMEMRQEKRFRNRLVVCISVILISIIGLGIWFSL